MKKTLSGPDSEIATPTPGADAVAKDAEAADGDLVKELICNGMPLPLAQQVVGSLRNMLAGGPPLVSLSMGTPSLPLAAADESRVGRTQIIDVPGERGDTSGSTACAGRTVQHSARQPVQHSGLASWPATTAVEVTFTSYYPLELADAGADVAGWSFTEEAARQPAPGGGPLTWMLSPPSASMMRSIDDEVVDQLTRAIDERTSSGRSAKPQRGRNKTARLRILERSKSKPLD